MALVELVEGKWRLSIGGMGKRNVAFLCERLYRVNRHQYMNESFDSKFMEQS